jgi:hypothetical protein
MVPHLLRQCAVATPLLRAVHWDLTCEQVLPRLLDEVSNIYFQSEFNRDLKLRD